MLSVGWLDSSHGFDSCVPLMLRVLWMIHTARGWNRSIGFVSCAPLVGIVDCVFSGLLFILLSSISFIFEMTLVGKGRCRIYLNIFSFSLGRASHITKHLSFNTDEVVDVLHLLSAFL